VTTDLSGVGVEDAGEAVPAVLVEEDGADEEQDGEASCHRGVLDGEDADRDHLRQDQGEHYGVVHDRPQLAPHFVLWVVHVQNLQDNKLIKSRSNKYERVNLPVLVSYYTYTDSNFKKKKVNHMVYKYSLKCAHLVPIYQVAEAEVYEQKGQYERRHDRKREAKQVEQEDFRHFGVVRERVDVFGILMAATYKSAEEVVDQVVHLQYLRAQTCPA